MAEKLLFCADNLFCDLMYPKHTISAITERPGFEAFNVGVGRRQAQVRWEPTGTNIDNWLKVRCDQLRAADFCAIDRNSNALGFRYVLEDSGDDFGTPVPVWDITLPTVPGGQPSTIPGAVTNELAWLRTWPADMAYDWRLTSKAMGAGLVPQLAGVYLGKAWQPTEFLLNYPVDDETYDIQYPETKSPFGWSGKGRAVRIRSGSLVVKPASETDYDMIEWQVLGLFAQGFPAWIVQDRIDGARRAFLAYCPPGRLDWGKKEDWPYRGITIPFIEEQPA